VTWILSAMACLLQPSIPHLKVRIVSNCEQSHHGCQAYKVTEGGVGSV